jgi:hypothetical protein
MQKSGILELISYYYIYMVYSYYTITIKNNKKVGIFALFFDPRHHIERHTKIGTERESSQKPYIPLQKSGVNCRQ